MSHSARSAWIETGTLELYGFIEWSHSARSAWIETVWNILSPGTR